MVEAPKVYIDRIVGIESLLKKKSYFLFGPRQTGKSSLIKHQFSSETKVYNLLDNSLFLEFNNNPSRLREEISSSDKIVIIDEIQRIPELLNEVHLIIEEKKVHFLLTGSSARKLRLGGVNLLGGRARLMHLHPFVSHELGKLFDLNKALNAGLIPSIYFSDDPSVELKSYIGTYLKMEVASEALTRNIPAFTRFLTVAGFCNASIVNFTKVADDAQVKRTTVYDYFEILKDTLLIRELPAYLNGKKRKPLSSSKYYFFDVGVVRQLQGRSRFDPGTSEYGQAFETFIINEVFAYSDYIEELDLSFWKSHSGFEVDLLINNQFAIEIKAKENITQEDIKTLKAIAEEGEFKRYLCVSLVKRSRVVDGVEIMPYQEFLSLLWNKKLI